ncbi:MAG: multifunctional oxoglutarate decarboxylase/oxoglutarate dehydrogenase thiamine pyrophosphate-binding subunit/dihydrolipoyllysine-residue succinyltransferase subunit [Acidithiobacillales bacterium]
MNQNADPTVVAALVEEFGANAGLALELYASYRLNPASVEEGWRRAFESAEAAAGTGPEAGARLTAAVSGGPAAPAARPAALPDVPSPAPAPAFAPPFEGDAVPLVGGAAALARNMDASLAVPVATSNRLIAAKTMEENRRILNRHREVLGQPKVSFTHFVAWGVLRALEKHPGMNDAYSEAEGRPVRVRRPEVNLGIAIDVTKKDGSRTLLVPNIRGAGSLTFGQLLDAFEVVVTKARKGQLDPDAFAGTTLTLTNPGTVGTTASAPRLMPGQGTIVATGAIGYPAEFASMPEEVLSAIGISRVMNVSSTYDHRIIQGAQSGQFLATLELLLLGGDSFYERIFHDLRVPHRPVRFEKDLNPPFFAGGRNMEAVEKQARVGALINAYRVRGHLVANLDPLGPGEDIPYHPDLDPHSYGFTMWDLDRPFATSRLGGTDRATLREILEILRQTYCGQIGAEFMYNADPVQKQWLLTRMESTRNRAALTDADRKGILRKLVEAEAFEKFLHTKYIGHKRFSLEGGEAAIPLLTRLLDRCAETGIGEVVIGMSHRGRLTVLTTIVGKPVSEIFAEFEDVPDPASIQGSGDVKYHLGAVGVHRAPGGGRVSVGVSPNPSHLEAVDPVVEGMVRAKQTRLGDRKHEKVMPVLIHGDAAFAGQGVVAETLNMSQLHGFRTGGTVHLVINNQIGFTTTPAEARTSTYCTDVAKMIQAPVFHVNGDDPEAALHAVDMALDYRCRFHRDVVVDLVSYRRYGHNEGDEPSYTQPLLYQKIKAHPSTAHLYGEHLVRDRQMEAAEVEAMWAEARGKLEAAFDASAGGRARPAFVDSLAVPPAPRIDPGLDARAALLRIVEAVATVPPGFEIHPKLRPLLKKRAEYASGRPEVDWAGAEMLAFGMLLLHGVPVRLSGQDSGRGTFSQRHAVLADHRTGVEYVPLNNIAPGGQAEFEVIDSLLSENAVLGFEFGYSVADPSSLVLWEAQFGDFANGAQIVIDQFVSGSEQKWNQRCGLVLLLPHGQEGQGPEHSSARLERFLTLSAEENLRVVNATTPAQYFHVLLRQMAGDVRKPLALMAPKSLLRHPSVVSRLDELADGDFRPVLDDPAFEAGGGPSVRRVVLASGKVFYDLLAARAASGRDDVALVRLEQLYPFPGRELGELLRRYPAEADLVWAQEEPQNMGAWHFLRAQLIDGLVEGVGPIRPLRYVGRRPLASPAPGSHRSFEAEQEALVAEALRAPAPARTGV